MRINLSSGSVRQGMSQQDALQRNQIQHKSFSATMEQQGQRSKQQLQTMIEVIQDQSNRLSTTMTVRELIKYKAMVRSFLEETARKGVAVQNSRAVDRRGRSRQYTILKEVDRQLLTMVESLLDSEQGKIKLLDKVGEIKGLLINFFY